ncbi:putative polysaccharide biosynthesis protein [Paenibacillus sp. 481]|uniref:putative polysaccharide biosynthesis protein n=1 Tax=Paenibacillus sp. 481 TaxID=2835869 RepID=UPI001E3E6285|nr:polysaccharide biosynthesis protein [Paenibacillus sp. 481]UHA75328.1 polysaccharide biosynthesis protein [Paenibacillus sp. 481]
MKIRRNSDRGAGQVLSGALTLGLATVISKIIGTLQKIPLQNIAGDGVFGIYNAVYPFYVLLVVIASAGIPVAVAKLVAECEATGNTEDSTRILQAACLLTIATGLLGFIGLLFGAGQIAGWIGNEYTEAAIRSSAYALLVMPVAAALRGFEQGKGRMMSTAVSQVVEQTGRVTVMIVLLLYLTGQQASDDVVAAGATFGSFAGGLCGLLAIGIYWWIGIRNERLEGVEKADRTERAEGAEKAGRAEEALRVVGSDATDITGLVDRTGETSKTDGSGGLVLKPLPVGSWMRRLVWTAIPICLGAIVMPAINLIDVFTLPRLLTAQGMSEAESMVQFGIYSRALPLVQLVTMVAASLAVGIVPAIAEAWRSGNIATLSHMTITAARWSWLLGLASAVGLAALAEPLNTAFYMNDAGSTAFKLLSLTAAGGAFHAVTAALLQGMGSLRAPMIHFVIAAIVKAILNVGLVPAYGINGAAAAAAVSLTLAAVLNAVAIARCSGVRFVVWGAGSGRLAGALTGMAAVVHFVTAYVQRLGGDSQRFAAVGAVAIGVPLGALTFAALAVILGAVHPKELADLPRVGPRLATLAARLPRLRIRR